MDRKSYSIPLGWTLHGRLHGEPILLVNSRTLVIWVGGHRQNQYTFEVERVPGSRSPHVPEKKPRYHVTWGDNGTGYENRNRDEVELVRLSTLNPRCEVLIPLETRRAQTCVENNGRLHGIFMNRNDSPKPYCGEYLKHISRTISTPLGEGYVEGVMPTCPKCLQHKAVWHLLTIHPHVPKREVIRVIDKEKEKERKYLALPTAYDRLLDDHFLDVRPPEPVVTKLPAEEAEDEDDLVDPRDRKRASAIDRNRRFKTAKASVKGHR